MTLAFKEWSYIIDGLGKGLQSIILRKGGIAEDDNNFELKANKFLLLPTLFHQASDLIKEDWLPKLDGIRYNPEPNQAIISYYAEVIFEKEITNWQTLENLHSQHAWKEEVIKERFTRWENSVTMLIVQVYKLESPTTIEMIPEYSGCKSWIQLHENIPFVGKLVENKTIKGTFF